MTKYATSERLGTPLLTQVDSVAQLSLGRIVNGYDDVVGEGGEFMYVRFGGAVTQGQLVLIDTHNKCTTASNANANSGKSVGVVCPVAAADTDYGFVQVSGKVAAQCNGAVVADAKVFLTATAGKVDDAVLAGCQLIGAEFATADGTPAANFAYVNINRPSIQTQIT
jgi:hypothetical protein